jgi:hypothetical protein
MKDEVRLQVVRLDGETYELPVSDELKAQLLKESEFGVNLPIDQHFQLVVLVTMTHTP